MPGYLELDGVKYCLIPTKLSPDFRGKDYFPGLALTDRPSLTADRSRFLDPFGHDIPGAVPVAEADFWAPHDVLYTIERWPCYPINFRLFSRLPLDLIDRLIQNTRTDWASGKDRGTYQVNWGGLTITRQYHVDELGAGVAIWPGRALRRWKQFFLLFAPGRKDRLKAAPFAGSPTNPELEPAAYGLRSDATSKKPEFVAGETAVIYGGRAAIVRSSEAPRIIALKVRNAEYPEHGVMPLLCEAPDAVFAVPGTSNTGQRRSVFSELPHVTITQDPATAHIAVDFGTTNTAVAIALAAGTEGEVLEFTDTVLARNLTEGWLDPSLLIDARFGFFAMSKHPSNPLPSVIVEMDTRLEPFAGQYSLPRRSIPGDSLDDTTVQDFVRNNHLKQEFKWQSGHGGEDLRMAFLEMLARLVGLQLRTHLRYRALSKAQVVFTCPLSFSHGQTEQLKVVQDHFKHTLEECGLDVSLRAGLVSESLANLYLIRKQKTGVGRRLPEERHVVIDIGGGSTDISIFTGKGTPLWLDSLYVGGKDLAETVLFKRLEAIAKETAGAALHKLFGTSVPAAEGIPSGKTLQQLLLLRMERDMTNVAVGFHGILEGTLADFMSLLAFATTYGVKMASLSASVDGEPIPGTRIFVWFVGLGSRLFELSPLARAVNDRLASARLTLESCCKKVLPNGTTVTLDWRPAKEAKLTVCRGALLVPESEPGLDLQTLFWADFPSAEPSIQWSQAYDHARVEESTDNERRTISTRTLAESVTAAVESISRTLGFDAAHARIGKVTNSLQEDYTAGAALIAEHEVTAPPHPIVMATEGLKENLIGLMKRPDDRRVTH